MRGMAAALAALAAPLALAACGSDGPDPMAARPRVFAAASLKQAFPRIVPAARATYSFAGSDALAFQIQRGAPADVFAAANEQYPRRLERRGLCGRPVTFATNVLVLVVPRSGRAAIRSVADLTRGPAKRVAVGQATVPIGQYTRAFLRAAGLSAVLSRNRVSSEPDVAGIVAKVGLGSADAGFVYRSDQRAAAARTAALPLPGPQPPIRYQACAVRRAGADTAAARRFIREVTGARGRRILRSAGFGLPRTQP